MTSRAALADVLATLTYGSDCAPDGWRSWWSVTLALSERDNAARYTSRVVISDKGASVVLRIPGVSLDVPNVGPVAWTVDTPADAIERLHVAGLWPWEPGEARWWCDACGCVGAVTARGGRGGQVIQGVRCDCAGRATTREECDRTGEEWVSDLRTPPSIPALVAVASLGASSLVTAAELAGVLAPGAVVVWRIVDRGFLRSAAREEVFRDGDASIAYVVAHEALGAPNASPLRYGDPATWPESFPWLGLHGNHIARRSWRAVRGLGKIGVLILSIDAHRVVFGVESL